MPHDPSMRPAWMIRARPLPLRPPGAARTAAADRARSTCAGTRPARRCSPSYHARASSTPTAGSTTRAWSCSTPWTRPSAAPPCCTRTALRRVRRAAMRRRGRPTLRRRRRARAAGSARARSSTPPAPGSAQFLADARPCGDAEAAVRLVKGSHIVVRRLFEHDHAYIFQNPDKRIIFAIPYEGDFTLIGTTDVEPTGAIGEPAHRRRGDRLSLRAASRYFAQAARAAPTWSGATRACGRCSTTKRRRPFGRDARLLARARHAGGAPLLSVFGGKITTYRKLAEEAADQLAPPLQGPGAARLDRAGAPAGRRLGPWIGKAGRPTLGFARFVDRSGSAIPALAAARCCSGSRAPTARVRSGCWTAGARCLGRSRAASSRPSSTICVEHEWARTAEDVLWRRSKLGLHSREGARGRGGVVRAPLGGRGRRARAGAAWSCASSASRERGGEVCLHAARPDAGAARGQRPARRDARRQDHADAPDGGSRRADAADACSPTARTSPACRCASATWRWSISSSSTIPP